jgi:putative endonuclease
MWYVYVLYSFTYNKFYIGFSNDLRQRVTDHKKGKVHTTARLGEFELCYYEACKSKKDAAARERQLKTGFGRGYLRKRLADYLNDLKGV